LIRPFLLQPPPPESLVTATFFTEDIVVHLFIFFSVSARLQGEGVLLFPDGSRFVGIFRDDECAQGQLWKNGVLTYAGPSEAAFLSVPPSSSHLSLHINFAGPLEEDALRLVQQRLRLLHKGDSKAGAGGIVNAG